MNRSCTYILIYKREWNSILWIEVVFTLSSIRENEIVYYE